MTQIDETAKKQKPDGLCNLCICNLFYENLNLANMGDGKIRGSYCSSVQKRGVGNGGCSHSKNKVKVA